MRKVFAILFASIALMGCGSSNNGFVATPLTNSGNPILPQAVNDSYTTLGNASVSFPGSSGVLNNDSLPSGGIDSFDATTTQNGSVSLNSDGSFTYTPTFGFTGTDTFTYTLANAAGTSTATVTIQVPEAAYFVNNSGGNGNGSLATPFNNIDSAVAASNENDVIFLFRGDGTSTGMSSAVTLKSGQSLIGEATGLASDGTIVAAGQRPNTTLQLTLADSNKISGLAFSLAGTGDIIFGSGFSGLTAQNNFFNTEASRAVNLENASGTVSLTENRFIALAGAADGVKISQSDSNLTPTFTISSNRFQASNTPVVTRVANPTTAGDLGIDLQLIAGTTTATISQNVMEQLNTGSQWQTFLNLQAQGSAQANLRLTDNTLSAISSDAVEMNASNSSLVCSDVTGNTMNQDLRLVQIDTSTFQVEEVNNLSTLNNGATIITSGTITNVADGTCQF